MPHPGEDERLAILVHDLENALAIVRGHAQLAHRRLSRGDPREIHRLLWRLEVIDQAAVRMSRMLSALSGPPTWPTADTADGHDGIPPAAD